MYYIIDTNGLLLCYSAYEYDMEDDSDNIQINDAEIYEFRLVDETGSVICTGETLAEILRERTEFGGRVYILTDK